MALNLNHIQVGQQVAVASYGSWAIQNQGFYYVIKANKVRIVIQRDTDLYERTFSAKTGLELNSGVYRPAFLESVEDQQRRNQADAEIQRQRDLWSKAHRAVEVKDIDTLESVIAELKAVA